MFVGTHQHTVDASGRLILPTGFRSRLADGAFITPLDKCLGILPSDEFEQMARNLEAEVGDGSVDVNALRVFAARADYVVPDSQGRMRLIPQLREEAELDRNVVIVGALHRIEVWNPERWTALRTEGTERLAEAITHGRGMGRD